MPEIVLQVLEIGTGQEINHEIFVKYHSRVSHNLRFPPPALFYEFSFPNCERYWDFTNISRASQFLFPHKTEDGMKTYQLHYSSSIVLRKPVNLFWRQSKNLH